MCRLLLYQDPPAKRARASQDDKNSASIQAGESNETAQELSVADGEAQLAELRVKVSFSYHELIIGDLWST